MTGTTCAECDEEIAPGDDNVVVSSRGVFCDTGCWEKTYGQPWPY